MGRKFLYWVVTKAVGLRRRFEYAEASRYTAENTPELLHAYAAFTASSQSGSSRQPFKGYDIWRLLDSVKPRCIAEMGSGTTSAVFALWAKQHGADYRGYEHHAHWAEVTASCLDKAGLSAHPKAVRCVPSRISAARDSTGFVESLSTDVDFIYVDGPPCRLDDGVKVPNDDVSRLLDAGGKPRAIVVDGRVETVDLLRSHPESRHYIFQPSLVYSLRKGLWLQALHGREHSVFLRIT